GGHHHHWNFSQRAHSLRRADLSRGTLRRAAFAVAGRIAQAARPAWLPPQDRHSAAPRWTHHRVVALPGPARRRRPHALQLSHQKDRTETSALLHRLHYRRDTSHHPRECASLAYVF